MEVGTHARQLVAARAILAAEFAFLGHLATIDDSSPDILPFSLTTAKHNENIAALGTLVLIGHKTLDSSGLPQVDSAELGLFISERFTEWRFLMTFPDVLYGVG